MKNTMTQVKFTIASDTVSAFKAQCAAEGVSMASVIGMWMKTRKPFKDVKAKLSTRSGRKSALTEYICLLNALLEKEGQYRDLIPEQFEQRYETADNTCGQLAEAIELLEDAY